MKNINLLRDRWLAELYAPTSPEIINEWFVNNDDVDKLHLIDLLRECVHDGVDQGFNKGIM